jgi:hypothetical protein
VSNLLPGESEKLMPDSKKPLDEKDKKPLPPQPKWFEVRTEVLLPATLTFRVYAKDAEDALAHTRNASPNSVKYRLAGKRNLKATVIEVGTAMVKLVKNLTGWR